MAGAPTRPLPTAVGLWLLLVLQLAAVVTVDGIIRAHRVPHPALAGGVDGAVVATPTAAQRAWMDMEVGAMINYGIGMPNAPLGSREQHLLLRRYRSTC